MHIFVLTLALIFSAWNWEDAQATPSVKPIRASAVTCFKTGEQISGMNKICYYDCLGSGYAITIKSHELCPLSVKR